ncbi:hypothetical protein D0T50_03065 [Bacteroides sp. 214]|uniref:lysine 5,6-aminomutase reactivase subunit KamB n=1 Tax=Bacteroides sp. 214 TaxID=2302935 RepID=UPI0013D0399F|nr:hypothetical protein [Bacteroides sp. 214]NDW11868.1 hypothetical protein [Bacteroides sp. 214]
MSFIDDILGYSSISIVGMAKNAGKTECMNYILKQLQGKGRQLAVTSIGLDGESQDLVSYTAKPEIEIYEGMIFVTSEKHYKAKRLIAEVLEVNGIQTSLGRLITARAITSGKVLLSGPADTESLKEIIREMKKFRVDTVIVDGAISRTSIASPVVTDAMVLATGAVVSRNIPELVRKTAFMYELIKLNAVDENIYKKLSKVDSGVWAIDEKGKVKNLRIPSILMLDKYKDKIFKYGNTLYVAGIITDSFLQFLRVQEQIENIVLIVKDFTRIFVSMESYYAYLRKGGTIKVLLKNKLLAVCINPASPDGFVLNSDALKEVLQEKLQVPVYDVRRMPENLN